MPELRCMYCGERIAEFLPLGCGWLPLHSCNKPSLEQELARLEPDAHEERLQRYEAA